MIDAVRIVQNVKVGYQMNVKNVFQIYFYKEHLVYNPVIKITFYQKIYVINAIFRAKLAMDHRSYNVLVAHQNYLD